MVKENIVQKYVMRTTKTCANKGDYMVTLRIDKRDEALSKVSNKLRETVRMGLIRKGKIGDVELTLFKTGKIIIHNLKSRDINSFLKEILTGK